MPGASEPAVRGPSHAEALAEVGAIVADALAGSPVTVWLFGSWARGEQVRGSDIDIAISAIVLWELAKLVQLGRLELDLSAPEFTRALAAVHIWPLDLEVCRTSARLDFAGDPADELIAATSVVHRVPLLTRDRTILSSELVPFA